ncbi:hypothetical protein ACFVH6_04470 [Spirillospora sp. NPDC127200]
MKSVLTAPARLLAAAPLLAAPLAAAPAHADTPTGKVGFVYSAPEISVDGNNVTWDWTVTNGVGAPVDKVVLTHRFTPRLKVVSASAPCEVLEATVRCDYGRLANAGRKKGTLVAAIPPETAGTVQINGRVTWQRNPDAADAR